MSPRVAIEPDPPRFRGGSGEPLVLLHGGGGTWRLWRRTLPYLTPHRDVLAPTLLGHWGAAPARPPSIETLADGVEREMDAAGFDTADIAGGSLGTWVALEVARRGRARSLTLIGPTGGWDRGSMAWRQLEWLYRALHWGPKLLALNPVPFSTRPRLRRWMTWHHFAHAERMPPYDFAHLLVGVARWPDFDEAIAWARDNCELQGLDEVKCPVLLAFPEKDYVLPRALHEPRLRAGLPHADVTTLPDTGHAAMVDDPELVAEIILSFNPRAYKSADRLATRW